MHSKITIFALNKFPQIQEGDDLGFIISKSIKDNNVKLSNGDVICIAQKVISKSEGCIYELKKIQPSKKAIEISSKLNKDPRKVEIILRESKSIIRVFKHKNQNEGVIICEHKLGFISANAAVDESNSVSDDTVITLPKKGCEYLLLTNTTIVLSFLSLITFPFRIFFVIF